MTLPPDSWLLVFAAGLTAVAAICDLRTGLIPNRLIAWGAAATVVLATVAALSHGAGGLTVGALSLVLGVVLVSIAPAVLYRVDGIGGGDVKLIALVGAALGPSLGLEAEVYAFGCAFLYAPYRLLRDGRTRESLRAIGSILFRPLQPAAARAPIPETRTLTSFRFGPAICLGTCLAVLLRLLAS